MKELVLHKKYFINGNFAKSDSVIVYTILFMLVTNYFVWYNNKVEHPGHGEDKVTNRLTLKKLDERINQLDQKIDKIAERVDKLTGIVTTFIIEQRKFNQYVLDVFQRNNLK